MNAFHAFAAHKVIARQFIFKSSHDSNTKTVDDVAPADMLWTRPVFALGTCLLPALPPSWRHTSTTWAIPVAPRGCPAPSKPPLGFIFLSHVSYRERTSFAPSPFLQNPISSNPMISHILNAS